MKSDFAKGFFTALGVIAALWLVGLALGLFK